MFAVEIYPAVRKFISLKGTAGEKRREPLVLAGIRSHPRHITAATQGKLDAHI